MNSIFAVWFLSEKHSIYIKFLLQERLLLNRFFAYFHSHSCHRASKVFFQKCSFSFSHFHFHSCHRTSKVFFQKCSLSLSHFLLYIFIRIIEHRKSFRKFCHSKDLNLSFIQNDKIYFITYYLFQFDDRFLIIQMLDVNKIIIKEDEYFDWKKDWI